MSGRLAAVLARALHDVFGTDCNHLGAPFECRMLAEVTVAAIPEPVREAMEAALSRCAFPVVLTYYDHDGLCGQNEGHRWHRHDETYCDGDAHEPHMLCHPCQPLVAP